MAASIDFYFDFISPYSYLANAVLPRLAARHEASIDYRPFCLLDLMKIVGNRPTTLECRNKGVYAMADLQRWAKELSAHLRAESVLAEHRLRRTGPRRIRRYRRRPGRRVRRRRLRRRLWRAEDLSQRSELLGTLDKAGFDGGRLLERAGSADYVVRLERCTKAAAERGVFGSPTMFVGEEMFFGNDRLDFLTEAVRSAAGSTGASSEQSLEAV